MKFGDVSLSDAEGAVLAHSVALTKGRLRKGRVLTPEDVAALRLAGISSVTVAQLGPADVDENTAAARLAAALVPDPKAAGIRIGPAATGRVNLFADNVGVASLDTDVIHAVNAIDPMITVATVPQFQSMAHGGMVATIKIISYAVNDGVLATACAAAQNALRMCPPVFRTARLVQTVVDGDDGEKGHKAIVDRLSRLDVAMGAKTIVPHRIETLAHALRDVSEEVIFILTGSATSDSLDVAPEAVRAAGGAVVHFGMPVDPGNLLFLGHIGDKPVIGLPGCARSPALNGADWVLERVLCGIDVTPKDIQHMGVGGLLKEIPTRPQPRNG